MHCYPTFRRANGSHISAPGPPGRRGFFPRPTFIYIGGKNPPETLPPSALAPQKTPFLRQPGTVAALLLILLGYTCCMAAPFMPSPLDCIGRQRFAFYPPIENGGPNEWLLGTGSRCEVQAVNAQTGVKIWIDRQYIGAVSDHTTVLTVGLRKALEFRQGSLQPRVKRVIEMPQAVNDRFQGRREQGPAAVVAIRLDDRRKSSVVNKAVVGIALTGLVLALLAAWFGAALHF